MEKSPFTLRSNTSLDLLLGFKLGPNVRSIYLGANIDLRVEVHFRVTFGLKVGIDLRIGVDLRVGLTSMSTLT